MDRVDECDRYRPVLSALAYRMLGSVMDAEDVVQEAYLRWQQSAGTEIASPRAYLTTVVTRLCLDHLRSARVQREEYIGPWLPEPLVAEDTAPGAGTAALADSLSMAFLVLLESLSPLERAVFLLHDVFAYSYDEIAAVVGKSAANCRQIAVRARRSVDARRPRFAPSPTQRERLTRQFVQTCTTGDMQGLLSLLAEDVTLWSDGGGKVHAARRPIHGADGVARFLLGVAAKAPEVHTARLAPINGEIGIVTELDGQVTGAVTLEIAEGRITGIRFVVNPEKLGALAALADAAPGHQ
jgi:RNA polymerase sigma-70 factor (ECF subfamily)